VNVALTYHAIPAKPTSYSYDVPEPLLREQLTAIGNSGLDPEVTFDDGDITQCGAALRVLALLKLKAIFFITLGWTGNDPRYMGWQDLERVANKGHRIGLHSWSHKLLTSCNASELEEQLGMPRAVLKERLGIDAEIMSLPGGRWNTRVLRACKAAGYKAVYTSDFWREPFELDGTRILGRMNVTGNMRPEALIHAIRAARSPQNRAIGHTKTAVQRILGDAAYHRLWSLVTGYSGNQEPGRNGY
jgi:peptidoglycan/xylan/chitin deacetylase (PgdA/CDA1 family)